MELGAIFTQQKKKLLPIKASQVADGVDIKAIKSPGGGPPDIEQVGDRQRPYNLFKIFPGDERGSIWLL